MTHGRPALSTGLGALDGLTGGGMRGDLWVVTGPQGVGKTLLSLGLARASALYSKEQVAFLTTQHKPEALRQATVVAGARLLAGRAESGDLTDDEQARLTQFEGLLRGSSLSFTRVPPEGLLGATQAAADSGVEVVVVDGLSGPVEDVLAALKRLATDTSTWLVGVVADVGPGRGWARLTRSPADVVIRVERDDLHQPNHPRVGEVDLRVRRSGRTRASVATVAHQPQFLRLVDMTPAAI